MRSFRQDARHSLRLIRVRPCFAAVTVLTLALGIGANTAIFSILDALVLRNLPVWRPNRLVQITAQYRNSPTVPFSFLVFRTAPGESASFFQFVRMDARWPPHHRNGWRTISRRRKGGQRKFLFSLSRSTRRDAAATKLEVAVMPQRFL